MLTVQEGLGRKRREGGACPCEAYNSCTCWWGSKWFDANMKTLHGYGYNATLELSLATPATLSAYELITANDNAGRNPVSWVLSQKLDGAWLTVHTVDDFVDPSRS